MGALALEGERRTSRCNDSCFLHHLPDATLSIFQEEKTTDDLGTDCYCNLLEEKLSGPAFDPENSKYGRKCAVCLSREGLFEGGERLGSYKVGLDQDESHGGDDSGSGSSYKEVASVTT
uniref:Uncharacterized protein n=1 Tax=Guillardia theta TaxID=55529 RepID=A0A7S4L1Q4_GUITH